MARTGSLLITGGAGYVGSHVVLAFREVGYRVVVLDDLSTGRRSAVPRDTAFVEGDVADVDAVGAIIARHGVTAVVHLAASIDISESLVHPRKYHLNNSRASANLIRACIAGGVERFVFASSATVYGMPTQARVTEDVPEAPVHPYGRSKLEVERMLHTVAADHGLRYAVLRYFNVAGADPLGRAGQSVRNAFHLFKVACEAATGLRDGLTVFGTDYATRDGTCVRDYIHVSDLADIHVKVLCGLEDGAPSCVLNCGYGRGLSVLEVIEAVRSEAGVAFDVRYGPRRPGDVPALVCDPTRLRTVVPWSPRYDLGVMARTGMAWERALAAGEAVRAGADARRDSPSAAGALADSFGTGR